jgi:hypothetical protein
MLDRLENLQRRWLALFGLGPDDPRRFVVAQVILYAGLAVIVAYIMLGKLTAEPEAPALRTIPEGVAPA